MSEDFVSSDVAILDLLRKRERLTVSDLATAMGVTATAVRQRLTRLLGQGYVRRVATRSGRGRPSHEYLLTEQGRSKTGSNFADLAIALWEEIRSIRDPEVRRGLIQRLASRMANYYASQVTGESLAERMESLSELFAEREIPFSVEQDNGLPVLTALACPYPALAEQDRAICGLERAMFEELLGEDVRLTRCRLNGENCCTFEGSPTTVHEIPT